MTLSDMPEYVLPLIIVAIASLVCYLIAEEGVITVFFKITQQLLSSACRRSFCKAAHNRKLHNSFSYPDMLSISLFWLAASMSANA